MDYLSIEPSQPVRVTLMLADYAAVADHKVTLVGGGWRFCATAPTLMALGGMAEVPWGETNRRHVLRIELTDGNGRAVRVATAAGEQPFEIRAEFEAGRPPGVASGTSFNIPIAVTFMRPPLPLGPHVFRVFLASAEVARLGFDVVQAATPA